MNCTGYVASFKNFIQLPFSSFSFQCVFCSTNNIDFIYTTDNSVNIIYDVCVYL